jgi:hypothetical protein
MKILFILKERFYSNSNIKSYGLINSSKQLAKYLEQLGHNVKIVTVIDGNFIDKEVFNYKPDIVVIEALWVTPDKLKELIEIKRYKKIIWVVRIHSDIGYLSVETMAISNITDYINLKKHNLIIAPNNKEFSEHLSSALNYDFTYLPNVVQIHHYKKERNDDNHILNIGCFGALRILKDQLFQAICAIKAADILHKRLHFHITVDEKYLENKQVDKLNPILKNLEELFEHNTNHKLVKHKWLENDEFQHLVKKMDLGLQLSYSESFNIVASDFVNHNILIVVSEAISWMPDELKTSTVNYDEAIRKIVHTYNNINSPHLIRKMHRALEKYNKSAKEVWIDFLEHKQHEHGHHDHHDQNKHDIDIGNAL